MMQQGIDIQLPRTATAGIETKSEPLILTIKANKKIYWGSTAVVTTNLNTKLKAHFKTQKQKQVYIIADKSVDYGLVAEVIAEVKAAGIENVGLVTLPK